MPTSPHRQHDRATADDMSRFIEQLPRALAAPVQIAPAPGADPAEWQITVTLASADRAALDALHPSAYQLCAAAQHAFGLAAIGSQIDSAHTTVRVRVGDGLLAFVGEAAPRRADVPDLSERPAWHVQHSHCATLAGRR